MPDYRRSGRGLQVPVELKHWTGGSGSFSMTRLRQKGCQTWRGMEAAQVAGESPHLLIRWDPLRGEAAHVWLLSWTSIRDLFMAWQLSLVDPSRPKVSPSLAWDQLHDLTSGYRRVGRAEAPDWLSGVER